MNKLRFAPPRVEFDLRLANELIRGEVAIPSANDFAYPAVERRSPFNGYARRPRRRGGGRRM
jgi:hypothetical protein